MVEKNSIDNASYNHYSQLALLQQEWGLPSMGRNDTTAVPFLLSTPSNSSANAEAAPVEANQNSAFPVSLLALGAFLLAL